ELQFGAVLNLFFLVCLAGILIIMALISGLLPAYLVARLHPVQALKGVFRGQAKLSRIQEILMISQYAGAILFILITLAVVKQINYMKDKGTGFNKENIMTIPITNPAVLERYDTVKTEFLRDAHIKSVSCNSFRIGPMQWYANCGYEGLTAGQNPMVYAIFTDFDFTGTFDFKIKAGRTFSAAFPGDVEGAYILNETAVTEFGLDSPIGKKFQFYTFREGTIIGVVKDFHLLSLHQGIAPTIFYVSPKNFTHFSVRFAPGYSREAIDFLKSKWSSLFPGQVFEYSFLDEDIESQYRTEMRLGQLFTVVSVLGILIAGMGLFGLTSFTLEQRIKEIGIRKVCGASVKGIVFLLSRR
ncbi:MAG: ABC transporter permease, partial [Candidatus Aminicenantes bacterium]|nr:ABC transporter permease [Candidatus Aminicenantes bacterium]